MLAGTTSEYDGAATSSSCISGKANILFSAISNNHVITPEKRNTRAQTTKITYSCYHTAYNKHDEGFRNSFIRLHTFNDKEG
jgi:hypothetical protein